MTAIAYYKSQTRACLICFAACEYGVDGISMWFAS